MKLLNDSFFFPSSNSSLWHVESYVSRDNARWFLFSEVYGRKNAIEKKKIRKKYSSSIKELSWIVEIIRLFSPLRANQSLPRYSRGCLFLSFFCSTFDLFFFYVGLVVVCWRLLGKKQTKIVKLFLGFHCLSRYFEHGRSSATMSFVERLCFIRPWSLSLPFSWHRLQENPWQFSRISK